MRARRGSLAALGVALLVLASCGGDGDGGGGNAYRQPKGAAQATITIDAGNFYFRPDDPTASAGINAIKLVGDGGLHTLLFEKIPGFQLEVTGSGATQTLKADFKPGKYVFYCDIAGHRQQGMEGTLTVRS